MDLRRASVLCGSPSRALLLADEDLGEERGPSLMREMRALPAPPDLAPCMRVTGPCSNLRPRLHLESGRRGLSAPSEETEQGDMTTHPGPNPERH